MSGKQRILVSDKLDKKGVAILEKYKPFEVEVRVGLSPAAQRSIIQDYDGLIVRSATKVDKAMLDVATRLKLVIRAGIGVDNIDVAECTKRGVLVENTPAGNIVSAAEHAIALTMALARQIPLASQTTKGGVWEKSKFMGVELTGKTFGVIGTGNIGAVVCNRAKGLHMGVIAADPMLTPEKAKALGVEKVELDELFRRADVISVHVPLLPGTKNMLNTEAFAKMKDGVLLINAARGGIVDEDALLGAIITGKVRGAALDVFAIEPVSPDHPLLKRDEVIATPHLGASTVEAQVNVAIEAAQQMIAFFDTGEQKNAINTL